MMPCLRQVRFVSSRDTPFEAGGGGRVVRVVRARRLVLPARHLIGDLILGGGAADGSEDASQVTRRCDWLFCYMHHGGVHNLHPPRCRPAFFFPRGGMPSIRFRAFGGGARGQLSGGPCGAASFSFSSPPQSRRSVFEQPNPN